MPKVTNNASSARGLLFKGPPNKRGMASPAMFERVMIAPGETADVDQKFLDTEGAKALVKCGDLSIGGAPKAEKSEKPADEKPAKPAKQAASKKGAGKK